MTTNDMEEGSGITTMVAVKSDPDVLMLPIGAVVLAVMAKMVSGVTVEIVKVGMVQVGSVKIKV